MWWWVERIGAQATAHSKHNIEKNFELDIRNGIYEILNFLD